jgi:hypothetical protein
MEEEVAVGLVAAVLVAAVLVAAAPAVVVPEAVVPAAEVPEAVVVPEAVAPAALTYRRLRSAMSTSRSKVGIIRSRSALPAGYCRMIATLKGDGSLPLS